MKHEAIPSYATLIPLCLLALAMVGCHALPDTPLTSAAAEGRLQEVQSLLARGADPNSKASHGWTALMWASRNGELAVMQTLLDKGANPSMTDTAINGWTALMHAIHKSQYQAAYLLLDRGADPNVKGKAGQTALMMAALDGNVDLVKALLAKGADPRAEASVGVTALSIAVSGGALMDIDKPLIGNCHTEVVKVLLDKAPDLQLKNNLAGRSALWFAKLKGCSEVLTLMEQQKNRSVRLAGE